MMQFKSPFKKSAPAQPHKDPTGASTPSSNDSVHEKDNVDANGTTAMARPDSMPTNRAEEVLHEFKEVTGRDEGEDEIEYPSSWKLAIITAALMLSVFCMALDNTIIATAIPRITDQFNSINDVGWYGSAYLLCTCAFQLFFGKLYTFYSIKWVYLGALFVFEVGSAVCGATPTSVGLIVGRAIAGLGGAGIFSGAILIIAHTVPLDKRPVFTGLIGAMYGLASVAGPLMGGAFTDHVSWRWCFYINLPIGLVTAVFIIVFFNSPPRAAQSVLTLRQKIERLDVFGTGVFVPAVVCLLLALQWGGSTYPWNNYRVIISFVFFGVLIIAFVGIQFWKGDNATVPPRILKQRSVWSGALFAAFLGGSFFVLVYFLPIWFQAIKGASATKSGIMNLPMLLGLVLVMLIAGVLTTVTGYYTPFMLLSTIFMSVGAGLLATFTTTTNHSHWIGYSFIFGAGVGFGMQQALLAVQTVLPLADVPVGTAIVIFAQMLGGAVFISVGENVFTNELIKNVVRSVPDLSAASVVRVGATSLKDPANIPPQYLQSVLVAYNAALVRCFYVSVACAVLSGVGAVFVEWKSVKKDVKKGETTTPA